MMSHVIVNYLTSYFVLLCVLYDSTYTQQEAGWEWSPLVGSGRGNDFGF